MTHIPMTGEPSQVPLLHIACSSTVAWLLVYYIHISATRGADSTNVRT